VWAPVPRSQQLAGPVPRKSFELVREPLDGIRARLSCTYIILDATICVAIPAHFVEGEKDNLDCDTKP
jgi:hypothetical protein